MLGFGVILTCTIFSLGGSFFIPREAGAQASDGRAPFNASEVVERASHHPRMVGDRIVIQDKAYVVEFSEGKAVLKAKEKRPGSEDRVIPVSGRPEVRDGKVVYFSWEGETEFEGNRRGLEFRERCLMPNNPLLRNRRFRGDSPWIRDSTFHFSPRLEATEVTTSGEFLLDTNIVYIPEPSTQEYPAIAFDGRNYMLVWEDQRSGYPEVYGARVTPNGVLLDTTGFPVSPPPRRLKLNPAIAFDGVNYLVVWDELKQGNDYNVCGTRVTPGGVVLDSNGIQITTDPKRQEYPEVVFGRSCYLVVWGDDRSGLKIYGARVTPSGQVLDPDGFPIATPYSQWFPDVAFDQRNFFVVWYELHGKSSNTEVYGARVNQNGAVLDTNGIAITNNQPREQEYPKVAFDGMNYFVAWEDARATYFDIYGARVTPAGMVLDTGGVAISIARGYQYLNDITFDGRNYLTVWFNDNVYGARVNPGGIVLDTLPIRISTGSDAQWFPVVNFDGRNFLVAWQDRRNSDYEDIYCARVTPQGVVLDPAGLLVTCSAKGQWTPAVAFDGRNYLAVWQEESEWYPPYSMIFGTRVSPQGVILDPARIAISPSPGIQTSPEVAFDGRNFLVVWQGAENRYGGVSGARVSPGGIVLDTSAISISMDYFERSPAVAFDGRNYLIVWQDYRGGSNDVIFGARVNSFGVVMDTNGIAISPPPVSVESPSLAYDGRNYLVVWKGGGGIQGARVTPDGVVLDPNPIVIANGYNDSPPILTFEGRNYLVVWSRWLGGGLSYDIYGARVTPTGVVLDPNGFSISTSFGSQRAPRAASDGYYTYVIWQDDRNGSSNDIYGAKLDPSRVVVDSFPVSLQSGDQITPDIVHGGGDQLLTVYSGFADSINHRPTSAMRIWGKLSPWSSVADDKGFRQPLMKGVSLRIYPNPFSEMARFNVDFGLLSSKAKATLKVYDALGRLVRDFSSEALKPGLLDWNGTDSQGRRLPGGVYFVRLEQGSSRTTEKVILVR